MTIPSIHNITGGNRQIRRIKSLGLNAQEEAEYKANLANAYEEAIRDSFTSHISPNLTEVYQKELHWLRTVPTVQLANIPARGED